jgi:alginate production protein
VDLDLVKREEKDRLNTYMLYGEYRGIEDIKLAAYLIRRDDRSGQEGEPLLMGVRSQGMPSDTFSYWIELAHMRGHDELSRNLSGYAYDFGGTYRFINLPFNPNVTLGYAHATGDDHPNHSKNNEFRQTGLQSNEAKFGAISDFKTYGEALDPELSNLKILTAGIGFRLAPNVPVDLVYHRYRLDEIADEIRNSLLTAQMNQDDTQLSKDVGSGFDIVIGIRHLFGVRRLGLDLRAGWFFPGEAFRIEEGDPDNPTFRRADKGTTVIVKFWY